MIELVREFRTASSPDELMQRYDTALQGVLDVHDQVSDTVARSATHTIDTYPSTHWGSSYKEAIDTLEPAYNTTARKIADVFDAFAGIAPNMLNSKDRTHFDTTMARYRQNPSGINAGMESWKVDKNVQPVFKAAFDAENLNVLNLIARREYRIWLTEKISRASSNVAKVATAACFDKKLLDEGASNMGINTNDDKFMTTVHLLGHGSTPSAQAAMANTLALAPGWSRRYLPLDQYLRR